MKFAILIAISMCSAAASAGPSSSEHYAASGDISALSACRASVELNPNDVGYSVSAQKAAEYEARTGKPLSSVRSDCNTASVGYSVSASTAATAEQTFQASQGKLRTGTIFQHSSAFPNYINNTAVFPTDDGRTGVGGLGSHRVGGTGSSGKGSTYEGGTGRRQ